MPFAAQQSPQEIRTMVFQNADKAMAAAKKENASLLAPKAFNEGLKSYLEAEKHFEQGEALDEINAQLNTAIKFFRRATDAAKLGQTVFSSALQARQDAMRAAAPKFAAKTWQKTESRLKDAADALEDGDLKEAREKAVKVEQQYRQAEREAIQQTPANLKTHETEANNREFSNDSASAANREEIDLLKQKVERLEQTVGRLTSESQNGTARRPAQTGTAVTRTPAPSPSVERFAPLNNLFSPEEGIVLRRGNDIVIRIFGLDFVERNGDVEMRHAHLLNKVQQALHRFPARKITVEGHTYIYGTAEENLKYSRERAALVKRYLQQNLNLRQSIVALGYGNTNPIPNHELTNGYMRNDRIDIVIARREETS